MICWFKQECSHLMLASLVYSKSVIRVFIALFVEYPEEYR